MEALGLAMRPINLDFWAGRRVLITGHTGFKGSWLSLWLSSLGADVYGIALPPDTTPSLFNEADVGSGMRSFIGDIRNYEAVVHVMLECNPEIVFHMAAQPLVRASYEKPIETYSTNVMGTVHVLEAARRASRVRAIVNVTTDKCYENYGRDWGYRECDEIGGSDPYSNSKGCSELVTSAYRKSFLKGAGVALASARAGNVIGGGDWARDRLVPDILRAFEGNTTALIRNPESTRPWQYVLDPLCGYLTLAECLLKEGQRYAEAWNFGPRDEDVKTVRWIAEYLAQAWGGSAGWIFDDRPHPKEAPHLKLDVSKAAERLHWQPKWNLPKALTATTDWHRAWMLKVDVKEKCYQQIDDFMRVKP